MSTLGYLKNLITDPNIASITPTSRFAVRRTCKPIRFSETRCVVEYGPGMGVFTEYLLRHLPASAKLIAFDTNENFIAHLRSKLSDSRLTLRHQSCEAILDVLKEEGIPYADYVISGIPFSMLNTDLKERIIRNTAEALTAEGRFLTYQFFPPAASFDKFLYQPLQRHFEVLKVSYEFRNVPPLRIYESRKRLVN